MLAKISNRPMSPKSPKIPKIPRKSPKIVGIDATNNKESVTGVIQMVDGAVEKEKII